MTRIRIVLAALLALTAFGVQAQDEPLTPLPLFASFIPNVQFAPLYVGLEEDLFAAQGYALEIIHGDENVGVLQIAQGELPVGLISGEQVILARANGIPVKYVYAWFQKFPAAVVAVDTVTLETPADLAGLRVGLPGPFGSNYTALTALLTFAGLTESDIDMQSIGYVAPDVVCTGGVDVAVVYINNEPLEIQRRIDAGECGDITGITVLAVSDFANMASNGIIASERFIAEHPDELLALTTAFDAASARAIANPAQAYLYSLNYVENLPQSPELLTALEAASAEFDALSAEAPSVEAVAEKRAEVRAALGEQFNAADLAQFDVLLASIDLWSNPARGLIDEAAWITTRDVMAQMGSVPADFDVTDAYTSEFVPAAALESAPSN